MLEIVIPGTELFDERTNEFMRTDDVRLTLEHSLRSIADWESKWKKPFLHSSDKTMEECVDYVRCMTLTPGIDSVVYNAIPADVFERINRYIEDPMTATTIRELPGRRVNREIVTSELIYYWMSALDIPFSCDKWPFGRLMTLIRVCNIRNGPQKKMRKRDIFSQNHALNAARKSQLGTRG